MPFVLVLLPAALDDLEQAALWYERNGHITAEAFSTAIEVALANIQRFPLASPVWRARPRFRAHNVRRLRFRIFYEVVEETITVHAIAHTSRRPGFWLER